ncbi:hypothetical protein [Lacrimispora amygdalina]|uniref:hypothetical protein n=1 Tax=Lacrimispora amygdalina TaxID=253257 RepID=UPI000BE22A57|nr:hypothetical protein [Lacrimispora amygdalina]
MNVKLTNRIASKLIKLKQNRSAFTTVASLEEIVNGATVQNGEFIDTNQSRELFKQYAVNKRNIDQEAFDKAFPKLEIIHSVDLMKNPYLENISLPLFENERLKLETKFHMKNEYCIIDQPNQTSELMKTFKLGIFDGPAYTYTLKENGSILDSVGPYEINTMKKHINSATGNVLVFGSGLAYYPYMLSLKNNVFKVVIVESDEPIYNFIRRNILPLFSNNKVEIILSDYENYMESHVNLNYDTVFLNCWRDTCSGAECIQKFAKYELLYPNSKFQYWLEDSILDTYVINIEEYFNAKVGTDEYQDFFKQVNPDLWRYMESIEDTISRPDQINYYLTRKFAKKYLTSITK